MNNMQKQSNSQFSPLVSRPDMPEYRLLAADQGRGLLPWEWARQRLQNSRNYWVATTRPDKRPHLTAVWGIWWDEVFYFSTGRLARKSRNLAQNPGCVVSTESAAEAVIVEGVASIISNPEILRRIAQAYRAKYGSAYPDDSNVFAVQPKVVFGFIEAETEFAGSATRWYF
jgi:hypothetical protein